MLFELNKETYANMASNSGSGDSVPSKLSELISAIKDCSKQNKKPDSKLPLSEELHNLFPSIAPNVNREGSASLKSVACNDTKPEKFNTTTRSIENFFKGKGPSSTLRQSSARNKRGAGSSDSTVTAMLKDVFFSW